MKILQICDKTHDFVKGFDLIEEVARAFAPTDTQFIFGVLSGQPDNELKERIGCQVKSFDFPKKKIKATNFSTMIKLVRYIRAEQIDVVITHRFKPWLLIAVASFFLPRCKFVSVFHAFKQFDRRRRQFLARLFLSDRWRIVAISDAVRADLIAHNIPAGQIVVIRNAIDVAGVRSAQITRDAARQYLQLPLDATVIGTIGRTKPIKGQKYLVEAFAELLNQRPSLRLIIIGGGEGEEVLRQQISALGIGERIIVTGPVQDAYRFLNALDLFVLPSISEGLGVALLEAMAAQLPVIGTNVGGIPEALGPQGITVPQANAKMLAVAIFAALGWSEQQRNAYIGVLNQHLMAEFDIGNYHARYRELLNDITSNSAAA